MVKTGLGKGLGALMGSNALVSPQPDAAKGERIQEVPLGEIVPSPFQPRKAFSEEQLENLVESIRARGIIQPLIVRRVGNRHELIAGERRWRAAQKAGLAAAPVIVRNAGDREVLELALVENLQRADLNPLEEAEGYQRLMDQFGLTQEDVAGRVGKKRATVANAVRLLGLPEEVRVFVRDGRISAGHAKAVLSLRGAAEQRHVAEKIIRENLTVRQAEKLVESIQSRTGQKPKAARRGGGPASADGGAPVLGDLEKRIQRALGTRVKIVGDRNAGRIEVQYFTADELDGLVRAFGVTDL